MPRRSKVARLTTRDSDAPTIGSHADVLDRRPNRTGRPTALTPDVEEAIIRAVTHGNHLVTACSLAGIHKATLFRWLQRAADADHTRDTGQPITPAEQVYCDFRDRLAQARAYAESDAVRVVTRSMHGGAVTSEKPATNENGEVLRDDNGEILYERTFTAPDGRLALSYLAKSRPDQWGNNPQRIEIVDGSADTGAGQSGPSNLLALAERVAIAAKQVRSEPLYTSDGTEVPPPEDVVEAEFTDEEPDT